MSEKEVGLLLLAFVVLFVLSVVTVAVMMLTGTV